MKQKVNKETSCIHSDRQYQGVNTPIFPSTANRYIGYPENSYPRYFNTENQKVVVDKLCKLENGEAGLIFSSGTAAIATTLFSLLKKGDHILFPEHIYGGTHKLIIDEFHKFGLEYDFVQSNEVSRFEEKIRQNTKAIYIETPSNPLLTVYDLEEFGNLTARYGLWAIADNTFASPINQNPLDFGFHAVLHSGTKYLGGHSDLSFGAVITSQALKEPVHNSAQNYGGNLNPLDCYLIERSLKTLAVRVKEQNRNAMEIACWLEKHTKVKTVYYPGLESNPGHSIAKKQMTGGFGGMLAFELKEAGETDGFLGKLKLIAPAISLGGVETIICQPSRTSHVKMPESERLKLGITDGLLRLSVGIENVEDLIRDLETSLK